MGSKQDMAAFEQMIQQDDFLVLDTETTGLHGTAEIVQIAIVNAQGDVLLDTLVKPIHYIPPDTTRIHGITNEMVVNAPPWAEVTNQVTDLLNDRDVVVYNAIFDRKLMHQSAAVARLPKTDWKSFSRWWCAMLAYSEDFATQRRQRYRRNYKLVEAARHYGIPVNGAHHALADAHMTLALVKAMVNGHS